HSKKRTNNKQKASEKPNISIGKNMQKNKNTINQIVGDSSDVFLRDVAVNAGTKTINILIVGVSGLIDEKSINESMINPLLSKPLNQSEHIVKQVKNRLYVGDIKEEDNLYQGILAIFQGHTLIIIEGSTIGIVADVDNFTERDVEEPPTGTVVR